MSTLPPIDDPRVQKVIEQRRTYHVDGFDWWDCIYEDFERSMKEIGVRLDADGRYRGIYFSLSYSQGDGACFDGSVDDWSLFLKAVDPEVSDATIEYARDQWSLSWRHRGPYCHSHSVVFDDNIYLNRDTVDDWIEDHKYQRGMDPFLAEVKRVGLHKDVERWPNDPTTWAVDFLRGKMGDLYRQLRDEYEYLTSDEYIYSTLHAWDIPSDETDCPLTEEAA